MKRTWILLCVAALLGTAALVVLNSPFTMGEDKETAKSAPQDSSAILAQVMKALEAAQKAADAGDAKSAAVEIAKAKAAVSDALASMKQNEGEMVAVANAKCPIMGMAVSKVPDSLTRIYQGRRLGFCCHDCPAMWDRLSAAEKEAKFKACGAADQKMVKVDNARCPIMNMAVSEVPEQNAREYKGKKIGFCCNDCPAAWDKLSDAEKEKKFALAMSADKAAPAGGEADAVVKVDNTKCPIMGMALTEAAPKNTREYKGKKVGFCCSDCPVAWDKLTDAEKDKKLAEALPK
jgi:YHS domain-containing protein